MVGFLAGDLFANRSVRIAETIRNHQLFFDGLFYLFLPHNVVFVSILGGDNTDEVQKSDSIKKQLRLGD
ncbi:unnamed protein product [Linum tenue]|uniref:Uncharacterized protein n=1 Tax=Linum tenue TaxID=586396 RepID=A0AAV0I7W0_9ROSI|nr:unnamed protein product [Linum tenue]